MDTQATHSLLSLLTPFITHSPLSVSPSVHLSVLSHFACCIPQSVLGQRDLMQNLASALTARQSSLHFSFAKEYSVRLADTAEGLLHSQPCAEALSLWIPSRAHVGPGRAYHRQLCTALIHPSLQSKSSFPSSILSSYAPSFGLMPILVSLVMPHPTFSQCAGGNTSDTVRNAHQFAFPPGPGTELLK